MAKEKKPVKDIKLEDNIFNIEPNDAVVKDAIVAAMAGARQGIFAKKKYPNVPAIIAKGNAQFFKKRRIIPILSFKLPATKLQILSEI